MEIIGIRTAARESWQEQLKGAITSPSELLKMLGLEAADVEWSEEACADFPIKVPFAFAQRMRHGDPHDPLLLQVMARKLELLQTPGYIHDPVGEQGAAIPRRGILHKYHGRVLLIVSSNCAVHCRYCFRRHFPYSDNRNSTHEWQAVFDYIREDPSIEEVILSGGDPLAVSDRQLARLTGEIADIGHIRRLRIHSRLPIVIPDRVTDELIRSITRPSLHTVLVVHSNHGNEIDAAVDQVLLKLRACGITTLNQSVLLAGINDSVEAQVALSERLFRAGVLPYYLHLLDKVQGAAHFDVEDTAARELIAAVSARLPGYLVPTLVREVAGAPGKLPIR